MAARFSPKDLLVGRRADQWGETVIELKDIEDWTVATLTWLDADRVAIEMRGGLSFIVEPSGRAGKEATLWRDDRSGESLCLYSAPSTYLHSGPALEISGHDVLQRGDPVGRLVPRRGGLLLLLPPSVPDPIRAFVFAMECRRFR